MVAKCEFAWHAGKLSCFRHIWGTNVKFVRRRLIKYIRWRLIKYIRWRPIKYIRWRPNQVLVHPLKSKSFELDKSEYYIVVSICLLPTFKYFKVHRKSKATDKSPVEVAGPHQPSTSREGTVLQKLTILQENKYWPRIRLTLCYWLCLLVDKLQ